MRVSATELPGVLLVEPEVYADERGYFMESWRRDRYAAAGIGDDFVQDNVSLSRPGVLRGLHVQHPHAQAKLISVLHGEVFDVAVDVRRGSPTFGRWVGATLSGENRRRLYIPEGFAHGFVVTGGEALVAYKVTGFHHAPGDLAVAWDDPDVGIAWPVAAPTMSARDRRALRLRDVPPDRLPAYEPRP